MSVEWGERSTNKTYTVSGDSLESVHKAMTQRRDEHGQFKSDIIWKGTETNGIVNVVALLPSFVITMPSWPEYRTQPQRCKEEWDKMWKGLSRHENGHKAIFQQAVSKLRKTLEDSKIAASKKDIDSLLNKAVLACNEAQDKYDARTAKGANQGAILHIAQECRSKQEKSK